MAGAVADWPHLERPTLIAGGLIAGSRRSAGRLLHARTVGCTVRYNTLALPSRLGCSMVIFQAVVWLGCQPGKHGGLGLPQAILDVR